MKSGDYSVPRDDESYRKDFAAIKDRHFVQRTFASRPALVAADGGQWREYHGEVFDASKFHVVEGFWDHEHCSVCFFSINEGYTYWENQDRVKLLCDACHEAMLKALS